MPGSITFNEIAPIHTPRPQQSPCSSPIPEESSLSSSDLHAEQTVTSLRAILTSHFLKKVKQPFSHTQRPRSNLTPRLPWLIWEVQSRLRQYRNCLQGGRKRARERGQELENGASTPNTAPGSALSSAPMTPADPTFPRGMMAPLTPVDPTATPLPPTTRSATASLASNSLPSTSLSPPCTKRTSLSPGSSIIGIWNALTHPSGAASSTSAALS
ncbi:hypothetical protein DL96DRAFT_1756883 [Flagelloscypha sp. PMI_526]|nr:hypothetical protein DL96DRAFT_1756883 [Flagelloscypha sp. PMI_526]